MFGFEVGFAAHVVDESGFDDDHSHGQQACFSEKMHGVRSLFFSVERNVSTVRIVGQSGVVVCEEDVRSPSPG